MQSLQNFQPIKKKIYSFLQRNGNKIKNNIWYLWIKIIGFGCSDFNNSSLWVNYPTNHMEKTVFEITGNIWFRFTSTDIPYFGAIAIFGFLFFSINNLSNYFYKYFYLVFNSNTNWEKLKLLTNTLIQRVFLIMIVLLFIFEYFNELKKKYDFHAIQKNFTFLNMQIFHWFLFLSFQNLKKYSKFWYFKEFDSRWCHVSSFA